MSKEFYFIQNNINNMRKKKKTMKKKNLLIRVDRNRDFILIRIRTFIFC